MEEHGEDWQLSSQAYSPSDSGSGSVEHPDIEENLSSLAANTGHSSPLVYFPKTEHTHTLILLHGRGDSAKSFGQGFLSSRTFDGKTLRSLYPSMKFIFPQAKLRSLAAHPSIKYNQWFDIDSLQDTDKRWETQIEGLRESSTLIHRIIEHEMSHIPCKNIILGGLSQGCATSLYSILTLPSLKLNRSGNGMILGAVVGMSGWLPLNGKVDRAMHESSSADGQDGPVNPDGSEGIAQEEQKRIQAINMLRVVINMPPLPEAKLPPLITPVFIGHGTADMTVDVSLGKKARDALVSLGMDVTWKPYHDFGHWYTEPDEIDDIVEFLQIKMGLEAAE